MSISSKLISVVESNLIGLQAKSAKFSTWVDFNDVAIISKWRTAAILDFGRIVLTSPWIVGLGSNFTTSYKMPPGYGSHDQKC